MDIKRTVVIHIDVGKTDGITEWIVEEVPVKEPLTAAEIVIMALERAGLETTYGQFRIFPFGRYKETDEIDVDQKFTKPATIVVRRMRMQGREGLTEQNPASIPEVVPAPPPTVPWFPRAANESNYGQSVNGIISFPSHFTGQTHILFPINCDPGFYGVWDQYNVGGAGYSPVSMTAMGPIASTVNINLPIAPAPQPSSPMLASPKVGKTIAELTEADRAKDVPGVDGHECVVCAENKPICLTLPCQHQVACVKCIQALKRMNCPYCETPIDTVLISFTV
jgi:hypothetical protein